mmetsp:Transcript_102137/g.292348  ORF Transcript_102137/g.292348 Transcript_102137/m.292348 type:complete len:209 (+) Transcript_102137:599-1225(+)
MHARPAPSVGRGGAGATHARAHTNAHAHAQRMSSHGLDPDRWRARVRRAAGAIAPRQEGRARGPPLLPLPVRGRQEVLLDVWDSPRASVAQKIKTTTLRTHRPQTPRTARVALQGRGASKRAQSARGRLASLSAHTAHRAAAPQPLGWPTRCFTVAARQHGSSTHSGTRPCGLTPLDSLEPPGEKLPLRTSHARRRGNLARRVPERGW